MACHGSQFRFIYLISSNQRVHTLGLPHAGKLFIMMKSGSYPADAVLSLHDHSEQLKILCIGGELNPDS